jgi:hypothetical protein
MTTNVRYAVVFDSLDEALDAHIEAHSAEVMELRPDGTLMEVQWDGQALSQPEPEPTPAGGSMFDEGLLHSLAQGLAEADRQRRERQLQEQQAAHERFWQEHQQREATAEEERLRALSELKMPGYKPDPDQPAN